MVYGHLPFDVRKEKDGKKVEKSTKSKKENKDDIYKMILDGGYVTKDTVSVYCNDLIKGMMEPEVKIRLTLN